VKVRFRKVDVSEAQTLARQRRAELRGAPLELTGRATRFSLKVAGQGVTLRVAAGQGEAVEGAVAVAIGGGAPIAVVVEHR
jgi:hypothetical protein